MMGEFDFTCAVSRTAIRENDAVLLVEVRPDYDTTYELLCNLHYHKEYLEGKKLPWGGGIIPASSPVERIQWGNYNSYGWIAGARRPNVDDVDKLPYFMVKTQVVQDILRYRDVTVTGSTDEEMFEILKAVVHFAFEARIPLFGNNLLGEQWVDLDEIKTQREALAIMTRALDDLEVELRAEAWDDAEEYDRYDESDDDDE